MPPHAQDSGIARTGSPASPHSAELAENTFTSIDAGRLLYNLPSPSEKLTDGTLPLSWPVPYLENMKAADEVPPVDLADASPVLSETIPRAGAHDDYVQLMRKLHAESALVRSSTNGDKALCAAHYISTLIAAMAFIAMMGIFILNFFPALMQP